nr:hypothetical protein [Tanacetum cinerariifolium]
MDRFSLIRAPNPTKVKTGSRPRAAHEVPMLTMTATRVMEMEDPAAATDSSGVPSTIKRSPLDFASEAGPEDQGTMAPEVPLPEDVPTTRGAPEASQQESVVVTAPPVITESRKRSNDEVDANAPSKPKFSANKAQGVPSEYPSPPHQIIPNQTKSPIEEPKHSFNMGYEHFNTNLVTNDVAESSTKNFVPIPRECKIDNLDEFSRPLIHIHIVEEERIRREHAEYINRMEMLFTINLRPHPSMNAKTNVESFSSLPIPIQESDPHQEEIDVVTETDDELPPSVENDDLDEEVDAVDDLRVDNSIQNSEHEFSESEDF